MKTSTKIAVAFVALAGVAGAALSAQADSRWQGRDGGHMQGMQEAHRGGGHGRAGGHMFRMMESFDLNNDGKLSQEEIDQSRGDRFGKFDANGDKTLTLGEYEQLWLDAMREVMVDRFQDLDADGDATVTAEEFARPFQKMVERRDRNGDGVIDRQDFQRQDFHRQGPRMPQGPDGQGPRGQGPDNG